MVGVCYKPLLPATYAHHLVLLLITYMLINCMIVCFYVCVILRVFYTAPLYQS
jgi:hypothetical protein